jgi:hypothetical protein
MNGTLSPNATANIGRAITLTAAVELAWDRDTDTVYVIRAWREKHTTPVLHAAALRSWGKRLIWTWPRDGRHETLEGAGISCEAVHRCGPYDDPHACKHR